MQRIVRQTSRIIALLIGAINLVRGLMHLLTQDSAAGEAGIAINHAGGADIVYLFAVIGGVQTILAVFYVYAALWNRRLLPFALTIEAAKTGLNLWIGYAFKPSQAEAVVGGTQDMLQLALALAALLLLGWTSRNERVHTKPEWGK